MSDQLFDEYFPEPEAELVAHDEQEAYMDGIASKAAFKFAAENGLVVVVPQANQLQLDIDNNNDKNFFHRNQARFEEYVCGIETVAWRKSRSGAAGKWHVTVTLERDVTPAERIAYQLMLGSDRVRETLSQVRLQAGDPTPTLFFEKE